MAKIETFRDISRNVEGFIQFKIEYDGHTGLVLFKTVCVQSFSFQGLSLAKRPKEHNFQTFEICHFRVNQWVYFSILWKVLSSFFLFSNSEVESFSLLKLQFSTSVELCEAKNSLSVCLSVCKSVYKVTENCSSVF